MTDHFPDLGRYISILDRLMRMYYDHGLAEFDIGWGQQFYVEYIYDHPGASAQEMVEYIRVDKATLTKTIRKLNDIGYIRIVGDADDRRVKRLYLTEKALPAVLRIKEIHRSFARALYADLPTEEVRQAEATLERMMTSLNRTIWHRMEE